MQSLWFKITLNKNQIDAKADQQVRDIFARSHVASSGIPDAILLITKLPDHTGAVDIYFSPNAAAIAEEVIDTYAGIPCNAPPRSQVTMFYGDDSAMAQLEAAA